MVFSIGKQVRTTESFGALNPVWTELSTQRRNLPLARAAARRIAPPHNHCARGSVAEYSLYSIVISKPWELTTWRDLIASGAFSYEAQRSRRARNPGVAVAVCTCRFAPAVATAKKPVKNFFVAEVLLGVVHTDARWTSQVAMHHRALPTLESVMGKPSIRMPSNPKRSHVGRVACRCTISSVNKRNGDR
jgi:hypothetical protein